MQVTPVLRFPASSALWVALAIVILLAVSCKTIETPFMDDSSATSDDQDAPAGEEEVVDISPDDLPDEPLIATFEKAEADYTAIAAGRDRSLSLFSGSGTGVFRQKILEDYLNAVMDRIRENSPAPEVPVYVYVHDSDVPNASAIMDGSIFVSTALLKNLQTEDELAGLLAHEFVHVLNQHGKADWWIDAQKQVIAVQSLVFDAWTGAAAEDGSNIEASDDDQQEMDKIALMSEAAQFVSETVIAPSYTRDQEDEADLLAMHLLDAAGYNPAAMLIVTDKLAWIQAGIAQSKREIQVRLSQHLSEYVARYYLGNDDSELTRTIGNITAEATDWVLTTWESLWGESHRGGLERTAFAEAYIVKHLDSLGFDVPPDHEDYFPPEEYDTPWRNRGADFDLRETLYLPDNLDPSGALEIRKIFAHYGAAAQAEKELKAGNLKKAQTLANTGVSGPTKFAPYPRLVFYQVRNAQENDAKAWANLELALDSPQPAAVFYRTAIERAALKESDLDKALNYAERAASEGGDPPSLWPWRIHLYHQTGKKKEAIQLAVKCRTEFPGALERACRTGPDLDQEVASR